MMFRYVVFPILNFDTRRAGLPDRFFRRRWLTRSLFNHLYQVDVYFGGPVMGRTHVYLDRIDASYEGCYIIRGDSNSRFSDRYHQLLQVTVQYTGNLEFGVPQLYMAGTNCTRNAPFKTDSLKLFTCMHYGPSLESA